jgi:hypothetical protein
MKSLSDGEFRHHQRSDRHSLLMSTSKVGIIVRIYCPPLTKSGIGNLDMQLMTISDFREKQRRANSMYLTGKYRIALTLVQIEL